MDESVAGGDCLTSRQLEIQVEHFGSKQRKRVLMKMLSPFTDDKGILRVGGRIDNALVSLETRHPALLFYDHRISRLTIEECHQKGHTGVATTVAKTRKKYWILVHMIRPRRSNRIV